MEKEIINEQLERFRKGFDWLEIVSYASVDNGIERLDEVQIEETLKYADRAEINGKCKFVPASGAASRMFKDIFAGMEKPNEALHTLASNIRKFAFYSPEIFDKAISDPQRIAQLLLNDKGLGYANKPKGVLKFHRYADEIRSALAEHLVETQAYLRNSDNSVCIEFTISPEHEELFKQAVEEVKEEYEKRYGLTYHISFSYQDKNTDTIAVNAENKPFLKEDGTLLTRPAGHGALIYNLNSIDSELVCIKNIDNVCVERIQGTTYKWKKVLIGRALQLRDLIRGYIFALDQITVMRKEMADFAFIPGYNLNQDDPFSTPQCQDLCNEIEDFLNKELYISMPPPKDCRDRAEALRAKLNRPIRVCGMVKNEGEPGGGPFIIRNKDGSTSMQILESAQINKNDPNAVKQLQESTHFNPVDIVCCLHDWQGIKFDLLKYVDENTGLISSKSYQGRELKALERIHVGLEYLICRGSCRDFQPSQNSFGFA